MSEAYEALVRELRAVAKLRVEIATLRTFVDLQPCWKEIEDAITRLEAIANELEA